LAGLSMPKHVCAGVAEGNIAYGSGDYELALKEFSAAAEEGDAVAQGLLGAMYLTGKRIPEDLVKAEKWLRKSAMQDDAFAQFNLGMMYYKGRGLPQSYSRAYIWLDSAVEGGEESAAIFLDEVVEEMDSRLKSSYQSSSEKPQNCSRDISGKWVYKKIDGRMTLSLSNDGAGSLLVKNYSADFEVLTNLKWQSNKDEIIISDKVVVVKKRGTGEVLSREEDMTTETSKCDYTGDELRLDDELTFKRE
ncbi:MAG: sel1 repeat family protein, partial [Deltaproteobacteria bacterium]|nr:sel1 repeat family protein [Deltaproteobacteria bacterium]